MKAVQVSQFGGPEVLQIVDFPTPQPAAGEVLIKVAAAGINYADIMQRTNSYVFPVQVPLLMGFEVAGTVEALGEGVTHVAVGQRVVATVQKGGYAEYAIGVGFLTFPLPDGVEFSQALALQAQGLTAVGLLNTGSYKSVLMLAAAGGVGSILVQVAKNRGIKVIGAVGSDAKKQTVLDLGADAAVSYAEADWVDQVRAANGGEGVDAVFDAVGGQVSTAALKALGAVGTTVIFGNASGEPMSLSSNDLVHATNVIRGYSVFDDAPRAGEYVQELIGYLQAGKLQLTVMTYPFAEVQAAHRDTEGRKTQGKVALIF